MNVSGLEEEEEAKLSVGVLGGVLVSGEWGGDGMGESIGTNERRLRFVATFLFC